MDPKLQILGSLKLAPIQCCAYGVPVTTGIENIDYFLSGESMELDTSQKYYSEKLIKLPALGIDYDNPNLLIHLLKAYDQNNVASINKIIHECLITAKKFAESRNKNKVFL